MKTLKTVSFGKNYDKLASPVFSTTRWSDHRVVENDIVEVQVQTTHERFKARVISCKFEIISELSDAFINYDTRFEGRGMARIEFLEYLRERYGRKSDWRNADSWVKVIWLEKMGEQKK